MKSRSRTHLWILAGGLFLAITLRTHAADVPIPPEDSAIVNKLVDQLSADDPADRDKASVALEDRPDCDLPLVQAAAKQDGLSPEARSRLNRMLKRMEPRAKARAKKAAYHSITFAWRSKLSLEYYAKDGHTNPAWDDAAKKAIELDGVRPDELAPDDHKKVMADEGKAIKDAMDAGCDDPDFLCTAGLFGADTRVPPAQVFALFRKALDSMADEKVSPFAGTIIDGRILRGKAAGYDGGIDYKQYGPISDLVNQMMKQYLEAVRVPGIPPEVVVNMAENIMDTAKPIRARLQPIFDRVYPPLEAVLPNDCRALTVKGQYYINWAWEARGRGLANRVTPQGWKDFAARLAVADDTLTAAWKLDPTNPGPPTKMLTVELGEDKDRDEMEKWFKRAMEADPDNFEACTSKMYYLEPKWHGNPEAMLEFGKQCFDDRNWHNGVALMLVSAHESLSKYASDAATYYKNETVWSDISTVYSAYLDAYPDNSFVRSKYAAFACTGEHWVEADALFKKLGDKADPTPFGTTAIMKLMRKQAADEAGKDAPAKP